MPLNIYTYSFTTCGIANPTSLRRYFRLAYILVEESGIAGADVVGYSLYVLAVVVNKIDDG